MHVSDGLLVCHLEPFDVISGVIQLLCMNLGGAFVESNVVHVGKCHHLLLGLGAGG